MPTQSPSTRSVLSADNLALIGAVARLGSMAAAARELGMVPSALTYRVRQIEDALDVLLFDRSARRAVLTPAGSELLRAGEHLLNEFDAVANRVKRVATGWEPQLTIVADALVSRTTLFELCEDFYATGAPTRLRIRSENLTGTLEALQAGIADLALGITGEVSGPGLQTALLGSVAFVYAVAPHHPLAAFSGSLCEEDIRQHRAVAVADTTQRGRGVTYNLLPGQEVLTVPTMQHKLEAQLRGLGVGFLPLPMAQPFISAGRLVVKSVQQTDRQIRMLYGWHAVRVGRDSGRALHWWLERLKHAATREALLNHHPQH